MEECQPSDEWPAMQQEFSITWSHGIIHFTQSGVLCCKFSASTIGFVLTPQNVSHTHINQTFRFSLLRNCLSQGFTAMLSARAAWRDKIICWDTCCKRISTYLRSRPHEMDFTLALLYSVWWIHHSLVCLDEPQTPPL